MSSESKRYSVEISDPQLRNALESADNRSEVIRDSLRQMMREEDATKLSDLNEPQQAGYQWLRNQKGFVSIDEATTAVAVRAQIDKRIVKRTVWNSLENLGLVKTRPRMWTVRISPIPPADCPHCDKTIIPAKLKEHIGDRHTSEVSDDE